MRVATKKNPAGYVQQDFFSLIHFIIEGEIITELLAKL